VRKCVKIFELYTHFVRLKVGNKVWGSGEYSGFPIDRRC
jgi:hypothetical protein